MFDSTAVLKKIYSIVVESLIYFVVGNLSHLHDIPFFLVGKYAYEQIHLRI